VKKESSGECRVSSSNSNTGSNNRGAFEGSF
jgi:hypothetical protein